MSFRRIVAGAALAPLFVLCVHARAQFADGDDDVIASVATDPNDLVFTNDFDGPRNGGTSCETAIALDGGHMYTADTTETTNWMSGFGPLFSPSNDVVYEFVAGPNVSGSIVPTVSNYSFAMYLIPTCSDSGAEPAPIGASATVGNGIDLQAAGVVAGNTYYLAITGAAFGGGGANGFVNFTTPPGISH
jgi:hypothetical protein